VETSDIDKTIEEMTNEGLITTSDGLIQLTEQGVKLSREWQNLLLKKEPILEIVAGLADGSITGLVVILSATIANLGVKVAAFATFLTLAAVAITNFSSFLLGGITEDLSDMITLQNLISYSLSDIPDKSQRDKSLRLVEQLFLVLHKEINHSNLLAAVTSGTTTFLAGILPIAAYLILPTPFNIIISLVMVSLIAGVFLVRYRSKRSKVHWKITLLETFVIIVIATIASLVIGHIG
jgi:uncharacterized membrane protein (UPF0136 family)